MVNENFFKVNKNPKALSEICCDVQIKRLNGFLMSLRRAKAGLGIVRFRPEGHWEPRNEVGSVLVGGLVGFESGTF